MPEAGGEEFAVCDAAGVPWEARAAVEARVEIEGPVEPAGGVAERRSVRTVTEGATVALTALSAKSGTAESAALSPTAQRRSPVV